MRSLVVSIHPHVIKFKIPEQYKIKIPNQIMNCILSNAGDSDGITIFCERNHQPVSTNFFPIDSNQDIKYQNIQLQERFRNIIYQKQYSKKNMLKLDLFLTAINKNHLNQLFENNLFVFFSFKHSYILYNWKYKKGFYWCFDENSESITLDYNMLIFLFSIKLLLSGGIVLHGAAILHSDETCLFLGHSSSGKSTITAMYPEKFCFGDDIVLIYPDQGLFFPLVSPFCQCEHNSVRKEVPKFPIKNIFFIHQAKSTYILPLTKKIDLNAVLAIEYVQFSSVLHSNLLLLLMETISKFIHCSSFFDLYFSNQENRIFEVMMNTQDKIKTANNQI